MNHNKRAGGLKQVNACAHDSSSLRKVDNFESKSEVGLDSSGSQSNLQVYHAEKTSVVNVMKISSV